MWPDLREVADINEAEFIELISGETSDFTVGKLYEVKVDDGKIFGIENERFSMDDQYIPNCEFFYNGKLELKFFKKVDD